jgi:hypothetical protein
MTTTLGDASPSQGGTSRVTPTTEHRASADRDTLNGLVRMWTSELLERLAGLRPEVYGGWTAAQLAAALRPAGALPQQVWGQTPEGAGANRQGYALAEITRGTAP